MGKTEGKGKRVSYKAKYLEVQAKLTEVRKELSIYKHRLKDVEKELELTDREAREYLDYLGRLKREFKSYKQRTLREEEKLKGSAAEKLIKEFLPILDDFELAIDSAKKSKNFSRFAKGVKMIFNRTREVLKKQGVKPIKAKGEEFNPHLHEAMGMIDSQKYPDNLIVEEMRRGYILNDKVLRPAVVKVNKRASQNPKK
ncbi:nucleotide exchange factor GrpE [Candidatus Aerophobetes bacterium]|uniref:Protein GrpE n=1 Tax=Aerophobetes bacterium TaxID=2030807 RepID=A0A523UZM4_UNCAE|nr:MAG: nucleotide exchange factor GrpE [Candidatus Aerophobetes bacterium]